MFSLVSFTMTCFSMWKKLGNDSQQSLMACPLRSPVGYSPKEARSLTVIRPTLKSAFPAGYLGMSSAAADFTSSFGFYSAVLGAPLATQHGHEGLN